MEFILKPFQEEIVVKRLANVHYFEFTPSYHTSGDSHPFCELLYVDSGSIQIVSENYTGELKQNEMILHGANQKHALACEDNVAPNVIIIGFECVSKELEKLTFSPFRLPTELQKMLAEIIKEARAVYEPPYNIPNLKDMKKRSGFSFGADQLIKEYLQIFLIKCLRGEIADERQISATEAEDSQIREVKSYLDENYSQKIVVDELCFLFGTNKTTLSKKFKSAYGATIIDYVNTLRIKHTKRLLRENRYTLTEIANMLNMSSVHYLTALFKKYVRLTPTEYLRTLKEKLS